MSDVAGVVGEAGTKEQIAAGVDGVAVQLRFRHVCMLTEGRATMVLVRERVYQGSELPPLRSPCSRQVCCLHSIQVVCMKACLAQLDKVRLAAGRREEEGAQRLQCERRG